MSQKARPDYDLASDGWVPAPLYVRLNEPVPDDATFVTSPELPPCRTFVVHLDPRAAPLVGPPARDTAARPHCLTVRIERKGAVTAVVTLLELTAAGTDRFIASHSFELSENSPPPEGCRDPEGAGPVGPGGFVDCDIALTREEAARIEDYTALKVIVTVCEGSSSSSSSGSAASGSSSGSSSGDAGSSSSSGSHPDASASSSSSGSGSSSSSSSSSSTSGSSSSSGHPSTSSGGTGSGSVGSSSTGISSSSGADSESGSGAEAGCCETYTVPIAFGNPGDPGSVPLTTVDCVTWHSLNNDFILTKLGGGDWSLEVIGEGGDTFFQSGWDGTGCKWFGTPHPPVTGDYRVCSNCNEV